MSNPPSGTPSTEKVRLFLSYGRADAEELAERLEADLSLLGFDLWRDRRKIRSGKEWDDQIEAGLRTSQLVVAVLTPHAVREESVCRDELAFARFACKLPIVPALAEPCEPPFVIFRLDYIDLIAWRDSPDRYKLGFRRLIDAIQAHFRGEPPRYRRWDDRFPQFDFGPFLYDKRRDFCGREWLFQRIDAWRADRDRHRALLITGDPGIGKSAIVAQLVHMNPGAQVLAYHCCRADTPETLRPGRFIRGLAGMIASQLDAYASQLDDTQVEAALGEARCQTDPASAFEEGILNPLHKVPTPAGGARYILIDALDEALVVRDGLSIVTLLSPSRLDRLPGWLRVVATTRKEPDVLRRLSGLQAEEIRADEPHNLDDIERFLTHRLGQPGLHGRLQASRVSVEEAIRRLREKSGGNFLWTEQALLGLETGTHDFAHLDALPTGLTGLNTVFFERHFPDDASYAPARRVLEVVTAALEPLTPTEIAAVTGLDLDYALPPLLDRLAAYLPDRDGRRAVFHKSFSDWLTETKDPRPAGRFFVSPRRGHTHLAEWCWAEYRRGAKKMSPYALSHLPAHLTEATRWDDLGTLLRGLPFLEAKAAEAGLVFELAADFTRAIEAIDRIPAKHPGLRRLRLLEQALRTDLHFLARHPTTLYQCLWNRGWWYDCREAERFYDPPPGGWPAEGPPWDQSDLLSTLLDEWKSAKSRRAPGFVWIQSLRPPEMSLGSAQRAALRGHEDSVTSVAFSPDGRRLASGSRTKDGTVRLWDADSGRELACLRGHEDSVTSVAFSPDGRRLASGSEDGTVRLWDADSGRELACLRGHEDSVTSVAFSPDGHLASISQDSTVRLWDAAGGELACPRGYEGWVPSVALSPDGRRLASGSWDGTVRLWDADSGRELAWLRGHEDDVTSVAFSPDGRRLASGSLDGTVRLWDADSGRELAWLRGEDLDLFKDLIQVLGLAYEDMLQVTSVAFSPDGRRLASGSNDTTVRLWDVDGGGELACLRGHKRSVTSVAFSPDGRRLASGSEDGTVRLWDVDGGGELACPRGHEDKSEDGEGNEFEDEDLDLDEDLVGVTSVVFSPDGRRLASGSEDGTVWLWDSDGGGDLVCLRGHEDSVTSVAFSPDGRRLITSGSEDGTVRLWDAVNGECVEILEGSGDVLAVAAGAESYAWRAMARGLETAIEPAGGGMAVAWFPAELEIIATHPSGRIWAGSVSNHLYLIRLEGDLDLILRG